MDNYDISKDIYRLNNIIQSHLSTLFKEYKITHLESRLLVTIKENENLNQDQLAMELNVTKNVVTQKIANLINLELINRIEDKHDRRNKKLYLSDKGIEIYEKINNDISIYNEALLNNIGDFNLRCLERGMKNVLSNAKKLK